jgi:hypothetical protein
MVDGLGQTLRIGQIEESALHFMVACLESPLFCKVFHFQDENNNGNNCQTGGQRDHVLFPNE